MSELDSIESAVEAIRAGGMIIVVDDDDRENEGDLIMAAASATPEQVAFTVSVDYRFGLTTGISAEERTATIRALANRNAGAEDFVRPGHIFPLIAREGGVLIRSGHTEAAIDLCRLAGVETVGVLAELVNDDGTVKRLTGCLEFAKEHGLRIVSIADLIEYRQRRDQLVRRVASFEIATGVGPATAIVYATPFDPIQHVAVVIGDLAGGDRVLARIHREQPLADLLGGGGGVPQALTRIGQEGRGVLLLLRDTVVGQPASEGAAGEEGHESAQKRMRQWRDVGIGAQILRDLGIVSIRLLAAHRRHYIGLSGFGIEIAETELLEG